MQQAEGIPFGSKAANDLAACPIGAMELSFRPPCLQNASMNSAHYGVSLSENGAVLHGVLKMDIFPSMVD